MTTSQTAAALRAKILDADDIKEELLPVEEWGVDIIVRGLESGERNDMITEARDVDTKRINLNAYYGRIVQVCALDPETRERIFAPDDVGLIIRKSPGAVDRIATLALSLSGMTKDTLEESVQEMGKDSSATPTGDSNSPSLTD